MVKSLALHGLRIICDVVYNHPLLRSERREQGVLDKIVPGYYHRRNFDGIIEACRVRAATTRRASTT